VPWVIIFSCGFVLCVSMLDKEQERRKREGKTEKEKNEKK
jgi:hypothetical protein